MIFFPAKGIQQFAGLREDLGKQLEYVYDVINEDPQLRDITKVLVASQAEQKSTDLDKVMTGLSKNTDIDRSELFFLEGQSGLSITSMQ